jgi:AcrR family transcriptional regulator
MKRKRSDREEKKRRTRDLLINSARAVFVRRGFSASTIKEIVEAAGYTRGAFYSNFVDKAELLIAVIERDHLAMLSGIRDLIDRDATGGGAITGMLMGYCVLCRNCIAPTLSIEVKLLAARDLRFRPFWNGLLREQSEKHVEFVQRLSMLKGGRLVVQAETAALCLIALSENILLLGEVAPTMLARGEAESLILGFLCAITSGS